MAKGRKGKPTRKERRTQKNHILLGDNGEDLDTQLKALGLITKCITGDGNCLFRALSDQYYGYDKHHKAIRQEVCQYLQENKDTYQFFVEDDVPFDRYLENMKQDGCFGGHMIIVGFAKLRQVDVKIYQPGMIYVIHGVDGDGANELDNTDEDSSRQVLHIAYHSWEHYSSVRNIDGPYNGMPEIKDSNDINPAADEHSDIVEDNQNDDGDSPDSKEKVILTACPGTNIRKIRRLLIRHKGNPDKVIDVLYEQQNNEHEGNTNQSTAITSLTTATIDKDDQAQCNIDDGAQIQPDKKEETQIAAVPQQEEELDNKNNDDSADNTSKIPETSPAPELPPVPESESTPVKTPKRLTAQQRKHQAKMRQKEQKREKKQRAASKHVAAKMNKSTETDSDVASAQQTMKQLFI